VVADRDESYHRFLKRIVTRVSINTMLQRGYTVNDTVCVWPDAD
jgi:hypothetical protein